MTVVRLARAKPGARGLPVSQAQVGRAARRRPRRVPTVTDAKSRRGTGSRTLPVGPSAQLPVSWTVATCRPGRDPAPRCRTLSLSDSPLKDHGRKAQSTSNLAQAVDSEHRDGLRLAAVGHLQQFSVAQRPVPVSLSAWASRRGLLGVTVSENQ